MTKPVKIVSKYQLRLTFLHSPNQFDLSDVVTFHTEGGLLCVVQTTETKLFETWYPVSNIFKIEAVFAIADKKETSK